MEAESSYVDSKDYKFFRNALKNMNQKSTKGEYEGSEQAGKNDGDSGSTATVEQNLKLEAPPLQRPESVDFDVESPNSVRGWKQIDPGSPLKPALKSPDLPKHKKLVMIENDGKTEASFKGLNLVDATASTEQTGDSAEEAFADFNKLPPSVVRKLQKKGSLQIPAHLKIGDTVQAKKSLSKLKLKKAESQYVHPH